MSNSIKERKCINIPFWIILIIIVVSDDTLLFGANKNSTFVFCKFLILIVLTGLLAFKDIALRKRFVKVPVVFLELLAMCVLVLLSRMVNYDLTSGYFYKCIILILGYEIANQIKFEEFAYWFEAIMFVLAVASVVGVTVATFARSALSVLPNYENTAGGVFHNAFLFFIPMYESSVRNYGIFREPGVYQTFLILAMLLYLYRSKELNNYKLIIYIVSIILTYSTTGYIALALFLIFYIFRDSAYFQISMKKIIMICLMIIALIAVSIFTDILSADGIVFNKLAQSPARNKSTVARIGSLLVNFEIWKKYPLFGAGLTKTYELFPTICGQMLGIASEHNTNTVLCELATYGIVYTAFFVVGYGRLFKLLANKKNERLLLCGIFLVLSIGEKLTFNPVIYVLMFYGMLYKSNSMKHPENGESLVLKYGKQDSVN